MKKKLLVMLLTATMAFAFGNDLLDGSDTVLELEGNQIVRERLAILPFTGGEGREGDTLAQMLGTELTRIGNFQIVPRTAAIEKVMEEHNFQRGGLTDGDTIVELGRGANARYVVSGHIQSLDDRKMISASILDVETFQQVAGDYYEYDDLSDVVKYLPELAQKIATGTEKDYSGVPTLAILPFDSEDENNSDVLAQLLAIELANSGKYVVVSRTTTIENVMKEQNIQRSGITESESISKLGIAMNADYVLSGSAYNLGNIGVMNVQIINVLNLVQENGAYIEYKTIEDGAKLMPKLSNDLTRSIEIIVPLSKDDMLQDLAKFQTLKWVGRGTWIAGASSLLASGITALVSANVKAPTRSDYSNYGDYDRAYSTYLTDGERDMLLIRTLAIAGGGAFVVGGAVDIIFSIFENNLLKELESQGFSISALPIIMPDFTSGDMNYGMHIAVKYSF